MSEMKSFADFSRPFVVSAKKVFETMISPKFKAQRPSIKNDSKSVYDISASIGLAGEKNLGDSKVFYKSLLVLSFELNTYIKIANVMLGESYTEYNEEIQDVAGEITNMIMGNAKKDLVQMGYETNMAIPSIVFGKGHSINYLPSTTVITIPIEIDQGVICMDICYSEKEF